jgi:hypothetical protein
MKMFDQFANEYVTVRMYRPVRDRAAVRDRSQDRQLGRPPTVQRTHARIRRAYYRQNLRVRRTSGSWIKCVGFQRVPGAQGLLRSLQQRPDRRLQGVSVHVRCTQSR